MKSVAILIGVLAALCAWASWAVLQPAFAHRLEQLLPLCG